MSELSSQQLSSWKQLSDQAVSGPWQIAASNLDVPLPKEYAPGRTVYRGGESSREVASFTWDEATAKFIAEARTAIPLLIQEIERLRQSVK